MSQVIKAKAADVRFENVSKIYGKDAVAVGNIDLVVEAGTLVTLLGPSGCGKTTTLRMIAGLELPTSGKIFVGGDDVTDLPATQRDIAMVFQSYALFPHMSVQENIAYGLENSGMARDEIVERTASGMHLVGLNGFEKRLPSELSGGQQQRVAVARAIVLEPQVLLFDEPLSNLDAKLRRQVREEIRELQTSLGLTVVYVTHDQEEALAVSDKIVVMEKAKIAQIGSPVDLYERPNSMFVADFIGEANILACEVVGSSESGSSVRVEGYEFEVGNVIPSGKEVRLAVRPRNISLSADANSNALVGTVRKVSYVGSHYEYTVAGTFGEIFAIEDATHPTKTEGSEVSISFKQKGSCLVPI